MPGYAAACCNWLGGFSASRRSALVKWFQARTADGRAATRKTMILALARKLLLALWRLVTTGEIPQGVVLRPVVA